jgi:ABC-type Fe3+/spermidine/putrescine transport system ATPase subunit
MDEPLASLDRRLRQSLQIEIRRVQRELAVPAVYVTHDQEEAMSMADRIVVLHEGRVEAAGTPFDLYNRPPSRFVATFIGDANVMEGTLRRVPPNEVALGIGNALLPVDQAQAAEWSEGDPVRVVVRPERVRVERSGVGLSCVVTEVVFLGDRVRFWLREHTTGLEVVVDGHDATPSRGDRVTVSWAESDTTILPREGSLDG